MKNKLICLCVTMVFIMGISGFTADDKGMIHIVFRHIDKSIPEGHFANLPKEIWRVDHKYTRSEEAPDSAQGIHGLIIISKPDTWMINRFTNSGYHLIDQGPTYNSFVPAFYGINVKIDTLEIGYEKKFFLDHGATQDTNLIIDSTLCEIYQLTFDSEHLTLFLSKSTGNPLLMTLLNDSLDVTLRYDLYEINLPMDSSLFQLPEGVDIQEYPAPH